jgi:hypothetical protein
MVDCEIETVLSSESQTWDLHPNQFNVPIAAASASYAAPIWPFASPSERDTCPRLNRADRNSRDRFTSDRGTGKF